MLNLKNAKIVKEYLKENKYLLYDSKTDVFGIKQDRYIYNTEENKTSHIKDMKKAGWRYYEEYQKSNEGLYVSFYDTKNNTYVPTAWFERTEDTNFKEWFENKYKNKTKGDL